MANENTTTHDNVDQDTDAQNGSAPPEQQTGSGQEPDQLDVPDGETSKRLYIIEYSDENERKRAEYTLKKWEDAEVERPTGTIRIVEAEDQAGLMNKLISTIPYDHIRAYELVPVEISETTETLTLERTLSADPESVEPTIEFMLSRRDGTIVDPGENKYEVEDRGPATVTYELTEGDSSETAKLTLKVSGAPQTTEYLLNSFRDELNQFERNRGSR